MTKKTKVIIASILVIILIVAGYFIFFISKSDRLTVTDIHDNVVYGKTTKLDLENRYGKPKKIVASVKDSNETFERWMNTESTITELLATDKEWNDSVKTDKSALKRRSNVDFSSYFDSYIEYRNKELGVNYVRFFLYKNVVYGVQFGNKIVNENAAKKDKYLKKILPYEG